MFDLAHSDMRRHRKRAVLTVDKAAEIFNLRLPFCQSTSSSARDRLFTSRSITLSNIYGVSPKAVRDIWNKRTWRHATRPLWIEDDELQHAKNLKAADDTVAQKAAAKGKPSSIRSIGRPRGSKDSKPRKPRQSRQEYATVDAEVSSRLVCPPYASHDAAAHDDEEPVELALPPPPSDDCLAAAPPAGTPTDPEDSGAAPAAASPPLEEEEEDEEALYRHFPFFLHFPLSVDAFDAA